MVSQRLIRIIGEFFFKMGKEADYIPLGGINLIRGRQTSRDGSNSLGGWVDSLPGYVAQSFGSWMGQADQSPRRETVAAFFFFLLF